jgi:hypothetical protein
VAALERHVDRAAVDVVYVYRLTLQDPPRAARQTTDQTYAANLAFLRETFGPEVRFVGMIGKRWQPDRILAAARALWDIGFDGVQIDYEPSESGNPTIPAILKLLRDNKPPGTLVSLATYMLDDPRLRPPSRKQALRVWNADYIETLAALVDDLMVMNYDTNLRDRSDYVSLTATQTAAFERFAKQASARLNIGVITNVPGRTGLYDRAVENFASGLEGVRRVWPTCPPGRGIAIFTVAGVTAADWADLAAWAR